MKPRLTTACASGVVALASLFVASSAASAQSADEVAKANNPLAPITAINFQNYAVPSIYGVDESPANSLLLRPVIATNHLPWDAPRKYGPDRRRRSRFGTWRLQRLPRHPAAVEGRLADGCGPPALHADRD
jgi:hypothetical protein